MDDFDFLLNDRELESLWGIMFKIHKNARQKGFWENAKFDADDLARRLMLIVTEVGEAFEAFRTKARSDHIENIAMVDEEIWDVFIRVCDLIVGYEVPIEILQKKVEFNRGREYKHGKEF